MMMADQPGIDLPMLLNELTQHQVKLALLCAEDPEPKLSIDIIWLHLPFDPSQFKAELQKLLFARLQQAS